MAFNTTATANQLVTILSAISGIGGAQIGSPESIGKRVYGYVTMGSTDNRRHTQGTTERTQRFMVMLVYRLDGAEATAETTLMGIADSLFQAVHNDPTLNGNVDGAEVQSLGADEPDYQLRAGKEYREYPILVTTIQRGTYAVNP